MADEKKVSNMMDAGLESTRKVEASLPEQKEFRLRIDKGGVAVKATEFLLCLYMRKAMLYLGSGQKI